MSLAGVGVVRFWGFSPALDLLGEIAAGQQSPSSSPPLPSPSPLRLLMLCPGDVRHLLKTLASAQLSRGKEGEMVGPIEASLLEKEPEVLARHALLLSIALDFELPRRERAELLLEVWANALLREKTAAYVAAKARQLSRVVSEGAGPLAPLLDVSSLKMKDRDRLEDVFRSWAEDADFEVVRLRDERLRSFYKSRYEHRASVLDWDYTWELLPIASIVHKIHFREWRMTGVLFEVRDSSYVAPNRTLASYAAGREKGASVERRGFWCDIANGPFAALGVECDEERLTAKKSDRHTKSSNDIAYYVMLQWLCAIENGTHFQLKQEDLHDFEYGTSVSSGGLAKGFLSGGTKLMGVEEELEEVGEERVVDVEEEAKAKAVRAKVTAAKMAKLPSFKLKLLCGSWLDVVKKPRHQQAFDAITLSTHVAYLCADPRINQLLKKRAVVGVETAKFLVELRAENRKEYASKLNACALALGWKGRKAQVDGVADACLWYDFDADEAAAHVEANKEAPKPEPLQLMAPDEAADDKPALSPTSDGDGRPTGGEGASLGGCLQIVDRPEEEAAASGVAAPATELPAEPVLLPGGEAIGADEKVVAELAASTGGKICVITGLPAKYKDPLTGLPYANLEAYKELRKRHPDPNKPAAAEKKAGGEPEFKEQLRPILTGGMGRRVNKACS